LRENEFVEIRVISGKKVTGFLCALRENEFVKIRVISGEKNGCEK
jgi:hypothetical protein